MPFSNIHADVVKPALIEISAYKTGQVDLEIRASIEALLTGINSEYKNTQDSPMASDYDDLRHLDPQALAKAFSQFEADFLASIELNTTAGQAQVNVPLVIKKIDIPQAGYTKVPRISTLWLSGTLPVKAQQLNLFYPTRYSDYAVRVRQVDRQSEKWHWSDWQWVRSNRPSQFFSLDEVYARKSTLESALKFIQHGFIHILPRGLDHILFILGLFLFSRTLSPLIWQVTMFTLAHTVTLGLATAGYIELPDRIVEPLIAISIAYIGFENIFATQLHKYRLALVFAFGLIHGLGFASVLLDFDMPKDAFFTSLLSFNVGVEIGQLAIIMTAWLFLAWWMDSPNYRRIVVIPASLVIGVTGIFWAIERLSIY